MKNKPKQHPFVTWTRKQGSPVFLTDQHGNPHNKPVGLLIPGIKATAKKQERGVIRIKYRAGSGLQIKDQIGNIGFGVITNKGGASLLCRPEALGMLGRLIGQDFVPYRVLVLEYERVQGGATHV